jgi:hypothetical protein
MEKHLSIVKVDKRPYRTIAQDNWNLTKEQMKGMHVHHRISVSDGGTNDASNLYVCTGEYHDTVWHGGEGGFIALASEGGKKGAKNQPRKAKVKGGRKAAELGVGAHTPGMASEGGKKSAELGVGVHAPGMASKGRKKSAELGIGVHAPGMASKGGTKSAELGVGVHAPGKRSEGGKISGSQRWQNTDPNYPPHLSTAAGLSHWQRARGIDTSLRQRVV